MSAHRDPELDYLGDEQGWDPELRELAQYLRATPHAYADVEPSAQFRQSLRRKLMREAWQHATKQPVPWYRRLFAPQPMAMAGAAVGAVLIVSVAFLYSLGPHETDRINVSVISPQDNAQLAPTVQPIELRFSTPMKTDSVQVNVEPATSVTRQWDTQHEVLTITPVHNLSANTQYKVTVTSATTADSKPVSKIKPVVFSTGPVPTPTPIATPRPTPPPSPIISPRDIAPIGTGTRAHWSIDGSNLIVISPTNALEEIPLAGGAVQKLADGATLFAVAPDGSSVAWLSGGQVTWKTTIVNNVQPIALGFHSGGLLLASVADVETADQRRVAGFKESADQADFSQAGDRVVYHSASGLHVVDLTTGRDTLVGPATGLGAWAPDGHHYAYTTDSGIAVADAADGSTAKLVDLAGVNGITWSRGNQLLVSTGPAGTLYLVNYTDPSPLTAHKLTTATDGTFLQPDWAANGSGQFSFRRGSDVWVAKLQNAVAGTPITSATPGVSQDDLVNSFMNARKNLLTDQALSFLDAAGKAAFGQFTLIYSDQSLARYYVLLAQPGREVVRLVLAHGAVQTAIDETLVIQADASNHPFIHSVTESPRVPFAAGPEVVSTSVTNGQVQVAFDSDLDPNSAVQPGAVSIRGVTTTARYDSRQKIVTLTVPGGLTPGQTYDLVVSSSLEDISQRSAVFYDLQFAGPAAPASQSQSQSTSTTGS